MKLLRGIGRLFTSSAMGTIQNAAVAIDGSRIAWVGRAAEVPHYLAVDEEEDLGGGLITPGLIDAHTHALYAGDRMAEVAARSAGAGYLEIARMGGGITATVRATRGADPAELEALTAARLRRWFEGGATTVEVKTGYHLDHDGEIEAVRTLARLRARPGLPRLRVTFLAAHSVPREYEGRQAEYVDAVAGWSADAAAAGADFCDVFCDEGYFSIDEGRRVIAAGVRAGLAPRIHADELARTGGSQLAAEVGAASADHLLEATDEDAKALAAAGVVATLAPGTAMSLKKTPPARRLLEAGTAIALGTDHNPGTSGLTSMSLVVALAVAVLGLSVDEALVAATRGGAASLQVPDVGSIEPGKLADLVLWDADHEGAFAWAFGLRPKTAWLGGAVACADSAAPPR
jgi:imidazolonepropionase